MKILFLAEKSGASCFKFSDIGRLAPGLGLGKRWQDNAPGSSGLVRALQVVLIHEVKWHFRDGPPFRVSSWKAALHHLFKLVNSSTRARAATTVKEAENTGQMRIGMTT
jgi:hypothetical protein